MTIAEWLKRAANELADDLFPSARLDAELILCHTLRKPRTYLHAHTDEIISPRDIDVANARLELRKDHVPVAYIIGHKDFYGRRFAVTPAVLIPRPESEALIGYVKQLIPRSSGLPGIAGKRLVDVGTGSGCLGVTAKLECPELDVSLSDISRHALKIAEKNARSLGADVDCFTSDLLLSYPYSPDIIVANLPYVDASWDDMSAELRHEPPEALYAEESGLAHIRRLIEQAGHRIKPSGALLIEADTRQLDAVARIGRDNGFDETERDAFSIWLTRS